MRHLFEVCDCFDGRKLTALVRYFYRTYLWRFASKLALLVIKFI